MLFRRGEHMTRDKTIERALDRLRIEGAKLVVTHTHDSVSGRMFHILPAGVRVTEETALKLLQDPRMQPDDDGLLPGHWQSFRFRKR